MRWNWTGNDSPQGALRILYNLVFYGPPVVAALGPSLPSEAAIVNQVAARFNIVQVGLASGGKLSDRSIYPYTVRAFHVAKEVHNARAAFFKKMGWKRIAFIYEDSLSFREYMTTLQSVLEANDVQVLLSEGVQDFSNLDTHLQNLKRQDARIIFVGFYKFVTLKLFCEVYQAGMYGPKYVWVAPFWTSNVWWINPNPSLIEPCTQEQINIVVNSTLHFDGNQRREEVLGLDFNGVKPLPEHYDYYNSEQPDSDALPYIYDVTIAIALALNASIADLQRLDPPRRLQDFSYSDDEMARVILKNADNLDFNGLLGRFLIENGSRRTESVYIEQARGTNLETSMIYQVETKQFVTVSEPVWQGDHVPVDGITRRSVIQEISSTARITLFALASLGSVMGLTFLFINIKYKHKRAIKMSSPSLSNLTVVGCLLLYASVFASGWDKTNLPDSAIVIKCHVERMLIYVGLSLAFGSVFMKTYRIHAIFAVAVKRFKKIDLPDWKLIGGVVIIVFADVIIVVLWIILDTTAVYTRSLQPYLDMTAPEKEIFDVPEIIYCSSAHAQYFTMALYGVKGVLLTFGLFLAWETRNICISQLNDSKYIAASVYIVSLTIALTIPTMTILGDDVNMTFVISASAILFVNTSMLCLNFLPKLYLLISVEEKDFHVSMMHSMGYGESSGTHTSITKQKSKLAGLRSQLEKKEAKLQELCKQLIHQ
ncbi:gamma-aminobutyric acid type B receptor subunit 2-like isoform X2 [Asterias amurensis]|uniref:gamma-aminobutyric acid type B receptor subunit 2-like isoform X2 n=1 Tax=Asterias amurensis TaxID=7602 RepID=UPI003AB83CC6